MTLKIYGKLPDTPSKLTAFSSLDKEGFNKYVIYDDVFENSDKTPLTVSTSEDFKPTLGKKKKTFSTVAPDQLFTIVTSSGYVTGQSTKHAYFCELKANEGYQFSEKSEIVISYAYSNPFTGITATFSEKIHVTEKTQTLYIFGLNQKSKISTAKTISATNLIKKEEPAPKATPTSEQNIKKEEPAPKTAPHSEPIIKKEKPEETIERFLNVYRLNNSKLKEFKENKYLDIDGSKLQYSNFIESIKPLKLNFNNLDVESGVKIGNNTLKDFTLHNLKNIENLKVASFNLSNMSNKNDSVVNLVNPFVKPFQLRNIDFGKILDIYLTWNLQKDLIEFKCFQNDKLVFSNSVKYSDKLSLYQHATSTVLKVGDNSETYENVFYLLIETNKIDTSQKVFEVDSYTTYNNLPDYFTCDNIENVKIPEADFDVVKKILKEGVYIAKE